VLAVAVFLGGCATIVEGTDQYIGFQISPETANCEIAQKGSILATISDGGGQVQIPKSRHDLSISCSAVGYQNQNLSVESSASGWGVVGCIFIDLCVTDYATGALNKYPKTMTISLKPTTTQRTPTAATPYGTLAPAAGALVQPVAMTDHGVRLGAYESADGAQQGWTQIWGQYWQQLSGVQPQMVPAQAAGGQPQYHLYGRGLTRERAENLCFVMQQSGQPCEAVRF
jgi:hypothetical protein